MKNEDKNTIKQLVLSKEQVDSVIALYSSGKINETIVAINALNEDYPNEALLYNLLGACYKALGQLEASIKMFETAVAVMPDFADAHFNLGVVFKEFGQLDAAVKCYEKAIAIKPNYADAHNNLGNTLMELNQLDAAVKCYEKALAIKPNYAEVHNNLGNVLKKLNQLDATVKCYEKALAIKPDYAEAHNNLGNVLKELNQLDAAVKSYEQALAIKSDYAEAHNNIGIAFRKLGQLDAAVKSYEQAIAIKPDFAYAHHNLGNVLMDFGEQDVAVKSYEQAIAIKPDYAEAYRNLSAHKKYTANDPQITQMQSLFSKSNLSQSDHIHLCFALAKVNEDLGNQDKFFKFLHKGNRLRKQELNYSFYKDRNLFDVVKKIFKSPLSLSYKTSTIRPIFIVGMPRSGTSLVEQIIASHHEVYGAGELYNLANSISPILEEYLNQNTNTLLEKDFLTIRQQYLDSLSSFNVLESIITDKMPLNFRYIGFILSAFPEAKIVHLKRDAMATCWSMYKRYFTEENGFTFNQEDLAGFYGLYKNLMDFWHQLFPNKIFDMCYEDLTTNQEEETRKLLKYCELDWDENCLNFHTSKRAVKTASALQVRQKMYQGSSEAWKKHEKYLQRLIKALSSY